MLETLKKVAARGWDVLTKGEKPLYKKWWFWVIVIIIVSAIFPKPDESQVKSPEKQQAEQAAAERQAAKIEEFVGKDAKHAMLVLEGMRYTVYFTQDGQSVDPNKITLGRSSSDEDPAKYDWVVSKIAKVSEDPKEVTLEVTSTKQVEPPKKEETAQEKLASRLPATDAWIAVEKTGQANYPYGFKLHYLLGKLNEYAQDENTWVLKATCDVTNGFGATRKATCEAEVTISGDKYSVTKFAVY